MRKGKGASIMDYFETLEDPRIDRCKRHQLLDIIAIAICAVICGADSWVYIELFGKSKLEWFQHLPGTAPRHPVPRHLRRRLLPAGPGAVPAVLHGLDPGSVRPDPRGSSGHRRQDGTAFPRPQFGPAGHPPGQCLGLGQHADPGAGEDRGEVQRNHRHPPVAANAGTAGVHRHYRRHGLPAGDRPGDSGSGSRLRAGAAGEPGSTV